LSGIALCRIVVGVRCGSHNVKASTRLQGFCGHIQLQKKKNVMINLQWLPVYWLLIGVKVVSILGYFDRLYRF
jgi:hypothetical protein